MFDDVYCKCVEGVDVVVVLIEMYGWVEMQVKFVGLLQFVCKFVIYKGCVLIEMDFDVFLVCKFVFVLIDELVYINVDGSCYEKCWQDVEEVLVVGIDVYIMLNIQYIEMLNEIVVCIIGVCVCEIVFDGVLEMVDEIELIDLLFDELVDRLKQGKVYLVDQVVWVFGFFFVKGNFIVLCELVMCVVVDWVDV